MATDAIQVSDSPYGASNQVIAVQVDRCLASGKILTLVLDLLKRKVLKITPFFNAK